jgi:hypothetical protein
VSRSAKPLVLNCTVLFVMICSMWDPATALSPSASSNEVNTKDFALNIGTMIPTLHGEVHVPKTGQLLTGSPRITCSELEVALSETSPAEPGSGLPDELFVSTSPLTGSIGSGKCAYTIAVPIGKVVSIVLLAGPHAPACRPGSQGPFVKASGDRLVSFGPLRMAQTEHLRQDLSIAFIGCV